MLYVFDLDNVCSTDILYNRCIILLSKLVHSSVIFSVGGRKILSISSFDRGIVSSGSWRSKT